MADNTIQHLIDIKFQYNELIEGWSKAATAIENAKKELDGFAKDTPKEKIAEQKNLIKALKNNLNQLTKEIQANVRIETQQVGSINQLNASITKLTARYNALSRTEREGAKGKELENKIKQLRTEVNAANSALLDFRGNVGNYTGIENGFTRLGFSVQQVARELPSLSHSVSQFFLAISNNLPMLAEELQRATKANAALKAEGKATVPVWKQLTSSIFSWQSLLVVGITLLTAYGKEIIAFVKGLFGAKEAAISMAKAQQDVNAELQKNGFGIGDQIAKFESLRQTWNNLAGDLDAKKKFVTENKEAFGELGVEVGNVNEAENLLVNNSDAFINALKARAIASAGMKLAAEKYEEALKVQVKAEEEIAGIRKKIVLDGFHLGADARFETDEEFAVRKAKLEKKITDEAERGAEALKQQAESYLTLANAKTAEAKATLKSANTKESAGGTGGGGKATTPKVDPLKKTYEELDILSKQLYNEMDEFWETKTKLDEGWKSYLRGTLKQRENEYTNRILSAKLSGGELKAQMTVLGILKEQLATFKEYEQTRLQLGASSAEIETERLELLGQIDEAEKRVGVTIAEIAKKQVEAKRASLNAVSEMAGAFGNLGEVVGGADNAFSLLMDTVQSVIKVIEAISKAEEAFAAAETVATTATVAKTTATATDMAVTAADSGVKAQHASVTLGDAMAEGVGTAAKSSSHWIEMLVAIIAVVAAITAVISTVMSLVGSGSSKAQKYSTGGLVTGAGTSTSDSITAKLSNGEAVMTAKAVNDWGAVLSAMNVASGGRAIDTSNLPQRGNGMRGMEEMMERVMLKMPAPVVSVVDINRGQNRVKVSTNLGRMKGKNTKQG